VSLDTGFAGNKILFCATVCRTEISIVGILFNEDDWQRMTTRVYPGEKQLEGNISIGRRMKSVGRDAEKNHKYVRMSLSCYIFV